MKDLSYSSILELNKALEKKQEGLPSYKISVLSNIITTQLNEILEYSLRTENINAKVTSGDYDNLIQDSLKFAGSNLIIVFWEAANLTDGLQYKANLFDENKLRDLISKTKSEIDLLFENLKNTSLVIFNKFSSLVFNQHYIRTNNFDIICNELNDYLETKKKPNVILLDTDKILAKISIEKSVDFRFYYSSKALYSINFYRAYSHFINPIVKSVTGKVKKVIIFDCDNTLWKGILGEDGIDKIEMSGKTKGGVVYEEIQSLALDLSKKGILIGLCSKNNPQDIEEVINNHPDMTIRNENITIKKINWNDKASNLSDIARELNIGPDSIVFVDDSDFEAGLVKEQLSEITVIQVPSNGYEFPMLLRENMLQLFFGVSETAEDLKRLEMYKNQIERETERTSYGNIETYLASLELNLTIHLNDKNIIPRIAQLTQKTNQFNLTTKRYTESEIENFISKKEFEVFAFETKDRFGDSGITGVCILNIDEIKKKAVIDTLLMSCRIIGRNIEFSFFDFLINHLKKTGIESLEASYIKSMKNEQVSGFYENVGFTLSDNTGTTKTYQLKAEDYDFKNINYIKVNYGREN